MKQLFTTLLCQRKQSSIVLIFTFLLSSFSFAQTYYSNFDDATGKFLTSNPDGILCLAPQIVNGGSIADSDTTNYASVSALLSAPLLCTSTNYVFNTYLNLPVGTTSVPAGTQAGFKVRLSSLLSATLLGNNIIIRTYLDGVQVESATGGASLLGLDVLSTTGMGYLYFNTTQPYNQVELVISTALIPVGVAFETDVYYAFASQDILPVKLANVKATLDNGAIKVSWQSLTETNLNHYEIERSSDGAHFVDIGFVPGKHSGSSATYSYTDKTSTEGRVLYRIKAVDNDGSYSVSNIVPVVANRGYTVQVYPSPATTGQIVNVTVPEPGTYHTLLYDAQGRLVRQQRATVSSYVQLPTVGLQTGFYEIKLISNTGAVTRTRLLIQ